MPVDERRYEFDQDQNAVFSKLAAAMAFVAIAMLVPSVIIGGAAMLLGRSTLAGSAIFGPFAIAVAIMAAQLYQAARYFRRIVITRGNDIDNLMVALDEMAKAYRTQCWLWVVVSAVVVMALATTAFVGR